MGHSNIESWDLRSRCGTPLYDLIIRIYANLPAIELISELIAGYSERIIQTRNVRSVMDPFG